MIKKMYNPGANKDNLIEVHKSESGCENCGDETQCQYTTAGIATINSTAIVVKNEEGDDVTYQFPSAAGDRRTLRKSILDALYEAGYSEDDRNGIEFQTSGNDTIVVITGEAEVVSLTNGGVPVAFTQCCDRVVVCDYVLQSFTGGAANTITLGVDTEALGELVYGTDTAAAVAAAINTAIGSSLISIDVTDDEPNMRWVVTLKGEKGLSILINGEQLSEVNCKQFFLCD